MFKIGKLGDRVNSIQENENKYKRSLLNDFKEFVFADQFRGEKLGEGLRVFISYLVFFQYLILFYIFQIKIEINIRRYFQYRIYYSFVF